MLEEGCTFLVDKPTTWTSFDVVNKLRYAIRKSFDVKKIKVGHAGTLDPLATGLLIVCAGKHTKKIESYMGLEKEYTGEIALGATTPSYDLETEINGRYPIDHIDDALIESISHTFIGEIWQQPPAFSAIKVNGVRAYHKARLGENVEIKKRKVVVRSFDLDRLTTDCLRFKVVCSKGTYIRSLAHDFGRSLHSGAYLKLLRRTKIGTFSVTNAWKLDDLLLAIDKKNFDDAARSGTIA